MYRPKLVLPLALVLGACGGTAPPAERERSPSTIATSAPARLRPGTPVVPGWSIIAPDDPDVFDGANITGLTHWRDQLIAWGITRANSGRQRGAIWTTKDGAAWTMIELDAPRPEAARMPAPELVDLDERDGTLVALWSYLDERTGEPDHVVSVSFTQDLVHWQHQFVGRGNYFSGLGYLAATPSHAGVFTVELDEISNEQRIWLWRSDDLRAWERIVPPLEVLYQANAGVLTTVGDQFVMGGLVGDGPQSRRSAAVWTSGDARNWCRSLIEPHAGVGAVSGRPGPMIAGGGRYPSPERSGEADAAAWISPDGDRWTALADPNGVLAGSGNQFGSFLFARESGRIELVGGDDSQAALWSWTADEGWSEQLVPGVGWAAATTGATSLFSSASETAQSSCGEARADRVRSRAGRRRGSRRPGDEPKYGWAATA